MGQQFGRRRCAHPRGSCLCGGFATGLPRVWTDTSPGLPGRDIRLLGGGSLFRSLLDARLVDTVEVAVIPVLLGGGVPLLEPPAGRARLKLTGHNVSKIGIASLEYAVI